MNLRLIRLLQRFDRADETHVQKLVIVKDCAWYLSHTRISVTLKGPLKTASAQTPHNKPVPM